MTALLIIGVLIAGLLALVVVFLAPVLRPKATIADLAKARTEALEKASRARRAGLAGLAEEHEATAARLLEQIERLGGSAP